MPRNLRILVLVCFWLGASFQPARAQAGLNPVIRQPSNGAVLQGVVNVTGSTDIPDFAASELDFTYAGDTTGTWFRLASSTQPVSDGSLASWDTTGITDGDYRLRLRVVLTDGTNREVILSDLRVRNYTPVETPTSVPSAGQPTPVPTATMTVTPYPTPTALPRNPAALTPGDVSGSVVYGGLAALLLLVGLSLYLRLRSRIP